MMNDACLPAGRNS